jgi:hypothetical protein
MPTSPCSVTVTAACPTDPDARPRWLPRSPLEMPLSQAGPAAEAALANAPASPSLSDIATVAAAWFRGSDASEAERIVLVLHADGLGDAHIAAELCVCRRSAANMLHRARKALVRRARDLCGPTRERAALTLWAADEPLPLIASVLGVEPGRVELALGRIVRHVFAERYDADGAARVRGDEGAGGITARRRVVVIG